MKNKKELPKIRQNQDVKKRASAGVRETKEYIYNKRATLTYDEVNSLVNQLVDKIAEYAYNLGWNDRNEIHDARKSCNKMMLVKAFNEFHKKYYAEKSVPLQLIEDVRYLVDIGLLNRYFNSEYDFTRQVNDFSV